MCEISTEATDLNMEEKSDSKTFCIGCFCDKSDRKMCYYTLHCSAMREIFKTPHVLLCYLCKRMLQNVESFIENVQRNKILLENFNVLDDTQKLDRLQIQPLVNLTQVSFDVLELPGKDETNAEEGIFSITSGSGPVNVKIEMKEEMELMDSEDFINGSDEFLDIDVKEEDLPINELLKEEIDVDHSNNLENENFDIINSSIQLNLEKEDTSILKVIYLTRKQCAEERLKMSKDQKYLDSLYKCINCIKGFRCKGSYHIHMEKHNQCMGDYECDICKKRMDTKDKLFQHMRYHEVRYQCLECGLIRKCGESIKNHYYSVHLRNGQQYICTKCFKSFTLNRLLRKHMSKVHGSQERVECAYCSRTYSSKDVLRSHMLLKHNKEISAAEVTKKYICSECGKSCKTPSQLKIHSLKHSDNRDFYCVECDKRYKSKYALKYHLKTASIHVANKELPLACSHCDKRFSTRRDVTRHTNRIHLDVRPYACDKCDKAYVTSWGLKDHKRFIHDGHKRPLQFPCTMCDKVFTRIQILKGHIRTHTGERPYHCSKCPATFNQASTLRTHDRRIHHKLSKTGRSKKTKE